MCDCLSVSGFVCLYLKRHHCCLSLCLSVYVSTWKSKPQTFTTNRWIFISSFTSLCSAKDCRLMCSSRFHQSVLLPCCCSMQFRRTCSWWWWLWWCHYIKRYSLVWRVRWYNAATNGDFNRLIPLFALKLIFWRSVKTLCCFCIVCTMSTGTNIILIQKGFKNTQ